MVRFLDSVSPCSAAAVARSAMTASSAWAACACLAVAVWGGLATAAAPQGFRRLAPGAITVIPADKTTDDTLQRADILEITKGLAGLAWTPEMAAANTTLVERSRGREYPRDIWCLEFAFKPPRMIDIDVPADDARMQRKRIWYMVYRVRNVGGRRLLMAEDEAGQPDPAKRRTEPFEAPVRFLPHFVLESLEPVESGEGMASYRGYLDRILPSAMEPIRRREDPRQKFLDSAEMSATDLAPGEERWGVATWEDIDPRIDFFSIYVRGLTNAVRWRQRPGSVIKPNDPPGSDIEETLESLRLDFWRPGDDRGGGDREMSVGFAGMFERMSLGGRLLAAVGWPQHATARPDAGLEALGLSWSDLLEPDAGGGAASLVPLETVLRRAAAVVPPADPIAALRALFGDLGVASIDELAAAAAGPVDAAQEQRRAAALQQLGLTPEAVAKEPLAALATILRSLEERPDIDARRAAATAIFGPAARRIEWLADAVAKARCLATLRVIEADRSAFRGVDALAAFEAFRPALDGLDEVDKRRLLESLAPNDPRRQRIDDLDDAARAAAVLRLVLQGVFGPRGPDLYAAAVAVNEGIDHAWVFRYETDVGGL